MDAKTKDRMLKILALAQGGVGGEKENAERMLEALCKKHGVSIDELEGKTIDRHWFYVNSKYEKKLLWQIVDMFVDDLNRRSICWTNKKRSRAIGFDLTAGEHAQIKVGFETYKAAWLEQHDLFFTAFVWKNRIWSQRPDETQRPAPTQEDMERALKVQNMMKAAGKVDVLPRIENDQQ